jgi:hypothetical protein
MIVALFLFIGLLFASLVVTYILSSVLESDKLNGEPALDAIIQTNIALMLTATVDLFGDITSIVLGKSMVFVSGLPSQALNLVRFGAVVGVAYGFHEGYTQFLGGGDTIFRTILGPFFQDVLFSVMQIVRLFYDALIPLYNYYSTMFGQLTSGSIAIAIKCDMTTVVETLKYILFTFISLFKSISEFAGDRTPQNNLMVNEWNITQTLSNAQMVVSNQKHIASCICDGLTDVFDLAFIVVGTPHLPRAVNHAFNVPIALIQEVMQILPPYSKFPLFTRLVYHSGSAVLETANFVDRVGITLLTKIIQLFIPDFKLLGIPEMFIFATQTRLSLAIVEALHVLYRVSVHILVPIPKFLFNADYMMKAMDFEKALLHLELWNYGNANMLHWTGMLSSKIVKGALSNMVTGDDKFVLEGVPEHVKLDCTKVSNKGYIKGPCAIYYFNQIWINMAMIANKLIGEVLWKSIFYQEQNLWLTFQRYDGMMISRTTEYSCEYRRDHMDWDVTRGECICEKPIGNFPLKITDENPFGDNQLYKPFCGQPTLQAHVWDPIIMSIRMAFEGSLVDAWYFPMKVQSMIVIEFWRLVVRTILAVPDIILGRYFDIPLNCGWGTGEFRECFVRRHQRNQVNYCTEENKEGCTCNPSLPLAYNSTCQCIYYFPDPEQEVTQTGFTNPLLENLYDAQHHWCGSYHFENFFKLADEVAYLIDNVISQFAPGYNSENNNYCESKAYEMLATDVLQYGQDEWNYDLLGNVSGTAYEYKKESCQLYGSYDVICSASMTLRTATFLVTQQLRGMVMTAVGFLTLDVQNFKLDFSERLCDLQRTAAGASATIAAMFPVGIVGPGVQQGLARMIYSSLDTTIVLFRFFNNFLLWFSDIIRGAAVGRDAEKPTFELIINQLNLWIDWLRRVFQAFGTFMNGLHRGAGKFFFTLEKILTIFKGLMSQAFLELFALIGKVVAGIAELFSAGGVIDNFFTDLFNLIGKFFNMLLQQMAKLWALIEPVLEPLMVVIRAIGGAFKSICQTIESAICVVSVGATCDIGCSSMRGHVHYFQSNPDTPLHIAESIDWDGTSRCDIMVHRYKNHTWNQLRPLEQIEITECLEQRFIAVHVANITELPIPEDFLYNWKRKYFMGFDMGNAVFIYSRHVFGGLSSSDMMREMKHDHVNLELYLPVLHRVKTFFLNTFTIKNMDMWVHKAFREFPNVLHGDTGVSNMYRFYIHSANFIKQAHPHVANLGGEFKTMRSAFKLSPKLRNMHDFNLRKHMVKVQSQFELLPPLFHKLSRNKPMGISKIKARQIVSPVLGATGFLEAAGLNADINPCHEQEDTYVCINCVLIDNFVNVAIREGIRMADYYENTFAKVVLPSFVYYFEKQERRAKAYREDMAGILQESMASIEPLRSNRFYSNATKQLSPGKLALKDWEYLFKNWAVRNDKDPLEIIQLFLSTVDDTYVPFTAHGLGYVITYPFVESCSMEVIYCSTSTTQERLTYITAQWGYQLAFWGGLYGFQQYTQTPVFTMLSASPNSLILFVAIYMYSVYGYLYTCLPNVPNCLIDDLFAWTHDVAYPQCFCQYYPGLSNECNPETCFLASQSTQFANCSTQVPLSESMGYFWSPVFWFRKEFPTEFLWLYRTAPFSWVVKNFESVKDIANRLIEEVPITLSEIDCLGLRYSDLVFIGIFVYVVSFALSIILPIGFKLMVHLIKMTIMLLSTIFAIGVATEVNTVKID